MDWLIVIGYFGAMTVLCIFSFHQLNLARLYRKNKRPDPVQKSLTDYPFVTVQLPVYNEKYVVERLIDSVCQFDYPKDKLEIQILDDSNDETTNLISLKVTQWSAVGINLQHIQRTEREGFKAGALQHGLENAQGEFIAIFDADFLPEPDFLRKTLPHFTENTGMVQTRWSHLNQDFSLLTRVQAFGLDAHFTVEQGGRSTSGKYINFNGTAGIWRKVCIQDAGGWQADTLTEDLDLSYRAQLKGWTFRYLESVSTPAELPILVPAIKSQQYRWNKGAAETARKHLGSILVSRISTSMKLHAAFHLLNSSVFIFLLIASLLSVPLLFIKENHAGFEKIFNLATVLFTGFIAISAFYWVSSKATKPGKTLGYYLTNLPVFLSFSMGLSLHNALAVSEGYLGIKTPFVRTPKFNVVHKTDSWRGNQYVLRKLSPITILEFLLALYFLFGLVSAFNLGDFGLAPFHLMLTAGFGSVAFLSVKSLIHD